MRDLRVQDKSGLDKRLPSDQDCSYTVFEAYLRGANGPRATRDIFELDHTRGRRRTEPNSCGGRAQSHLSVEDQALLRVLDEYPDFAGAARLSRRSKIEKQDQQRLNSQVRRSITLISARQSQSVDYPRW